MTVDLHDAGAKLEQLAETAIAGEEVMLTRGGQPLLRLMPVGANPSAQRIGMLEGMYDIPDDFDTMFDQEIEEMFYGETKAQ